MCLLIPFIYKCGNRLSLSLTKTVQSLVLVCTYLSTEISYNLKKLVVLKTRFIRQDLSRFYTPATTDYERKTTGPSSAQRQPVMHHFSTIPKSLKYKQLA